MFRALLDREIFCDCVGSGGDAIACLAERSYALIVVDFSLPHAGAAAIVESLRMLAEETRPMVIATATVDGAPDSDLVQMVFRRPMRVRDVADLVAACLAQVSTRCEAPRKADTARSIDRSGTST
jgi:hypothetical protein